MGTIESQVNHILGQLDELDKKREIIFQEARKLNRLSGRGIALILQNEDYKGLIDEGNKILKTIYQLMDDLSHILSWNSINSEIEEFSEFIVLANIIESGELSTDHGLIPPSIWLSSLGDVVGELRRIVLRSIIEEKMDEAIKYYEMMNTLSFILRGLVYSKTLIPNLRRKIDMVRAVTEKTDSDITNALIFQKVNKKLGNNQNE